MYRAVTLYFLRNGAIKENDTGQNRLKDLLRQINIQFKNNVNTHNNDIILNGENVEGEIRNLEVSNYVSQISKLKFVREKMVDLQRNIGKAKGLVIDGRDIGSVVFPNAEIKIFMTADLETRIRRRYNELIAKGEKVSFEEIKENIIKRDEQDTNRTESPLIKAPDAIVLDNSNMGTIDQMIWFEQVLRNKKFTTS
jgi:CMP/dCMP kinase